MLCVPPTLFLCIKHSSTLTLDPKDLLLGLLSPQRAHHLHHLPSPVVFSPQSYVSSSVHFLLSTCHCWLGQATVLSHLGFHDHCHHFLCFHTVLLLGLPFSTLPVSPRPSMNPAATRPHCSGPSTCSSASRSHLSPPWTCQFPAPSLPPRAG